MALLLRRRRRCSSGWSALALALARWGISKLPLALRVTSLRVDSGERE